MATPLSTLCPLPLRRCLGFYQHPRPQPTLPYGHRPSSKMAAPTVPRYTGRRHLSLFPSGRSAPRRPRKGTASKLLQIHGNADRPSNQEVTASRWPGMIAISPHSRYGRSGHKRRGGRGHVRHRAGPTVGTRKSGVAGRSSRDSLVPAGERP